MYIGTIKNKECWIEDKGCRGCEEAFDQVTFSLDKVDGARVSTLLETGSLITLVLVGVLIRAKEKGI